MPSSGVSAPRASLARYRWWRGAPLVGDPIWDRECPSRPAEPRQDHGTAFGTRCWCRCRIGKIESTRQPMQRPWERGRRRTRQDQISSGLGGPVKLRSSRDPHRTKKNQFLLPDRFSVERLSSSKGRSSRLTWCLADTLFRRPEPSDL